MRIQRKSIKKTLRYVITGYCEVCGNHYSISHNINVGASTQNLNTSSSSLVSRSVSHSNKKYWDILNNIFTEPTRFSVNKRCPSCGHIQLWMEQDSLTKRTEIINNLIVGIWFISLIIFAVNGHFIYSLLISIPIMVIIFQITQKLDLDRFFNYVSTNSKSTVSIPTSPNLQIFPPYSISTQEYSPEIPFGLKNTTQACLFTCQKNGCPKKYVKFLGTKILSMQNYQMTNMERELIFKEMDYFSIIKKAPRTNPQKLNNNILFAVSLRINDENWMNLARLVEDYHSAYISQQNLMKLLLPEDNGGISDNQLLDRKFTERYFLVDRSLKEDVICKDCMKKMRIPVDPLPEVFTCPNCGVTKKCRWNQTQYSKVRHIRLEN